MLLVEKEFGGKAFGMRTENRGTGHANPANGADIGLKLLTGMKFSIAAGARPADLELESCCRSSRLTAPLLNYQQPPNPDAAD